MTTPTLYTIRCEHGAHCTYCLTPDDRRPRTREDAEELARDIVDTWDTVAGEPPLLTVDEATDEEVEEHLLDILPLLTAAPVERIEVYEDNAGGVWLVPAEHGIAIDMSTSTTSMLEDCHGYGTDWFATDAPECVFAASEITATCLIATYDREADRLVYDEDPHLFGRAAREYIGIEYDEAEGRGGS